MDAQTQDPPHYAGFFRRLLANIIDGLIYLAAFQVIMLFVAGGSMLSYVLGNLIGVAYYAFCLNSPWQATIGKRVMNVFIQTKAGEKLSVIRW